MGGEGSAAEEEEGTEEDIDNEERFGLGQVWEAVEDRKSGGAGSRGV